MLQLESVWTIYKTDYSNNFTPEMTCFRLPETLFQVCPSGLSRQAPFLYQIFSRTSMAHTWPMGLTVTYNDTIVFPDDLGTLLLRDV